MASATRKPAPQPTEPVSFTIRRPTPSTTPTPSPLSLSRDASTGPDSDSCASAPASFKVPAAPPHVLRGREREREDEARTRKGSPLATGLPISASKIPTVVDSSDEDEEEGGDEPVTAFDKLSGALNESTITKKRRRSELEGGPPLVIPALKNRDWRELAKRRRGIPYVPGQITQSNMGTKAVIAQDAINTGPVLIGLQVKAKTTTTTTTETNGDVEMEVQQREVVKIVEETDDQKALRLILAESEGGGDDGDGGLVIETIPTQTNGRGPITEAEALKQDVEELPDPASLEDYARVPVSQFGAALLRGMGWEGPQQPQGDKTKNGKGKDLSGLYLPEARPPLLGIGAKEQEVYDDGSSARDKRKKREGNLKGPYIPVKQVSTMSRSGTGTPVEVDPRSRSPRRDRSRRGSRSPGSSSRRDRDRRRDRRD